MSVPAPEAGPVTPAGLFAPQGASAASAQAVEDKEMFLNLMVAQLRYQDPSNPADMGQFMAQNAQFQALEKMQEVADATTALMTQQMAFGAAGLVGREVTWPDADGQLVRGTVGAVSFSADGPVLDVAGHSVTMNQVQSVGTPDAVSAPTPVTRAAYETPTAPSAGTPSAAPIGTAPAASAVATAAAQQLAAAADTSALDTVAPRRGDATITESSDDAVGVLL